MQGALVNNMENLRPFDLNEPIGAIETSDLTFSLPMEEQELHPPPTNETSHLQESRNKRVNSEQRTQILFWLLNNATANKLQRGAIKAVALQFSVPIRSVSNIWNTAMQQRHRNESYNVCTKFQNCGRKKIEVPSDLIKSMGMGSRSCIRDLAANINISKSTVHRMIKDGFIRPHSNTLHPTLNDANKLQRLQWVLSLLSGATPQAKTGYYPMYDFVHLDEKWFYLSKKTYRVYLAQNERGKHRSASSSKFIPKVMFTAVVGRPRFNTLGECTFDGKIGIFPFTYQEAAKRGSKNRDKGTLVTKIVESVNRNVTRDMLINHIIPAIKAKWSEDGTSKVIFIQQDNAKAHIKQDDVEWQQVYNQDGFTFILIQQPPNSPDLNILDLGFFRSIQSLMHKKMPKDVDKMLESVNEAFFELHPKTLSNVWMSLQYVMNEILKVRGGNEYDLPHVNKKKLEVQGNLRGEITAPSWAVMEAWNTIHGNAQTTQTEEAATSAYQETLGESTLHEAQDP